MSEDKTDARVTNRDVQTDGVWQKQQAWLRDTFTSMGDAVITTDNNGDVTFLNPVAQSMTGWTQADAVGKPLDKVFRIIHEASRVTVENPVVKALRDGATVRLADDTLLIAKDGTERLIGDSAAPIHTMAGVGTGVVLIFRDATERRRHEQQLRDALDCADSIIATMRDPFLVLDQRLRVVSANRSFYENFHVAPEETQGRYLFDLGNHQWDIPRLRTLLEEVLPENHAFQDFEMEHDFPTLGRKVMLLNARHVRKPENHSERILLTIADVTERRTLDKISGTLAAIVQSSSDAIVSRTRDGKITSWNSSAEEMFGYTFEEAIGQNISLIIPPEGLSEENAVVARVQHGEHVDCYAAERITKHGQRIVISLTASPIRDARGQIVGISKTSHNITEQRTTQRLLEASEKRFRRLFEAAHDGILIVDAVNHKITHVNPFLTNLLDYPAEHFLGKELWEIGVLGDKQASRAAMQQLGEEGSLRYESFPLEDRHGHKHPVEVVANLYQEDHHPVIQCNIRDIADRSRLETLQRDQAAELSELHLRKDEFLAMLSHELRSPLAPIANAVQLLGLQRGNENRIQQQARGIIERQLKQLQHLVDDLLEVSRITTGRVQLRREPAIVSNIVEDAVETVRPLIEQRRHELTVSLPPDPIWLHADVARLEQVLVNLLTNAAKYTEIGGHVWLTAQQEGEQCVLRVRDTGLGIAPALLPRIFDLFTQSERSLDRSQGGLGIGLALVQRLTELHEGKVEAHSTVGEGSEFIVRLPVMSTAALQPTLPGPKTGQLTTRPLRVLVVDDNVDTVLSLSMLLKTLDHDVRTAHDGPTAVLVAIDYQPDVVLLDIGLPGLNGYEVATRIRQQPRLRHAVLVAVTGYGQEADRQTSLQAGFDHHLVKPARLAQLQQILTTVEETAKREKSS